MRRLLTLLLALAVLGACSDAGSGAPAASGSAAASPGSLRPMSHADALALAGRYRDEAAGVVGGTPSGEPTSKLVACEGRTYAALTYRDVALPADQQSAALQRLRDHYTAAKYAVAPSSADGADHALNATGPDRVTISVGGDGGDTLRINVATPCYSSDEPL